MKHANWHAPKNISALSTTKKGGWSNPPFASNNLALHVGDETHLVGKNRQQLKDSLQLPGSPIWLNQTHSVRCVVPEQEEQRDADAAVTRCITHPLVILTADCLPITLCNKQGSEIAAIHAGWRGLFNGVIENTLKKMHSNEEDILAWIGPAISQQHYEVGEEVYLSFTSKYPQSYCAFTATKEKKWLANLPLIAQLALHSLGVMNVTQSNLCTYSEKDEFYSYRRAPQTGRIATLIWFNDQPQD